MSAVKEVAAAIGHLPLLTNYFIPLALICAQDGKCFYCDEALQGPQVAFAPAPRAWTHDHVVPRQRGGTGKRNRVIACYACNQEKDGRMPTADELRRMAGVHERAYRWLEAFGKLPPGTVLAAREYIQASQSQALSSQQAVAAP